MGCSQLQCRLYFGLIALILLSYTSRTADAVADCATDEKKCKKDECCVLVEKIASCQKLHEEGDSCEMKGVSEILKTRIYKVKCPCAKGLECQEEDGLYGKLVGKCQKKGTKQVEDD